jgi:hypothetical protein
VLQSPLESPFEKQPHADAPVRDNEAGGTGSVHHGHHDQGGSARRSARDRLAKRCAIPLTASRVRIVP